MGTIGGPISKGKVWFFAAFEYVPERASIAYSPATLTQFQALATLASDGLIPGVNSIATPSNIPVPFRDYLGDRAAGLVSIVALAMVFARCRGQLHHAE